MIDQKNAVINGDSLPIIEAIPLQMNQLFYNLISNALKFSVEGIPPVIDISLRLLTEKEIKKRKVLNVKIPYCEIVFKDN